MVRGRLLMTIGMTKTRKWGEGEGRKGVEGGCCRPPWLSCAFLGDRMDTQGVPVPSAGHPIHCAGMCRLS